MEVEGRISAAEVVHDEDELFFLDLTAEDGAPYRFTLTRNALVQLLHEGTTELENAGFDPTV